MQPTVLTESAPLITCPLRGRQQIDEHADGAADGLWHANNVGIVCTARDTASGLANPADARFTLTTSVPLGSETADARTGTHEVCDLSNHCATAGPIGGNMIDRKGPLVAIAAPANAVYLLGQTLVSNYSCADYGSGTSDCAGPVANGSSVDTSSVGAKTFAVTGTDAVGNRAVVTNSYVVTYLSTGQCLGEPGHQILQPINADSSSVFKKGSTVPAKFRVCSATGMSIGLPGVVTDFRITEVQNGLVVSAVNEPVDSTTPDSSFRWSSTNQQWVFNINTTNLSANTTYNFRISLRDGSVIDFRFGVK